MLNSSKQSLVFWREKCALVPRSGVNRVSEAAATPESDDGRRVGQINIPIADYGGDACGGGNGGQPFVCLDSGFGKSEKRG